MKNYFKSLVVFCVCIQSLFTQAQIKVVLPEAYELSNVILALTEYGQTDKWEVQKPSKYYKELITFFEPVKNHPLLKQVNYSREKWEDYLSFRTDAYAFEWDKDTLKRKFNFKANKGHQPFDDNLESINDFVKQSKFRLFFKSHKAYYDSIISNYAEYYMLNKMKSFLELQTGYKLPETTKANYYIVLSPLVGRMNCHRDIDKITQADFPNIGIDLLENFSKSFNNVTQRAVEIHTLFTEMDHAYINPISARYKAQIAASFQNKYWDNKSGYAGISCFNEYMTWAVYDLFINEQFPKYADSINLQWHYQNASRGFYASALFANIVERTFDKRVTNQTIADIYPKIITLLQQKQITNKQVKLVLKKDSVYTMDATNQFVLNFSTPMQTSTSFACELLKMESGKGTNESKFITVKDEQIKWLSDKQAQITLTTDYTECALIFNWWGCGNPLIGKNDVLLTGQSYILLKK
jgi:hypothetical protein